ncbi:hypothetical protein [Pontibacter sp. G13]|uniref:toxin-antitoxin system YwqK family antitoxin n=1 Tax=Pontibacter sp. G13 TaxID=3074898 RepID=UPI00288A98E8|nr:hypothetical protein [Pontibacter sp. G13]WNJ21297.1 hypothetical protein RJD25_12580 [Pontibacter sp. G13]
MKIPFALLCFAWFVSPAFAQIEKVYNESEELTAINPINEDGVLEGNGYSFYESGAIASETPYVEGKIHGTVSAYFPDGSLKSTCDYERGRKHGLEAVYFGDGKFKLLQSYKYGRREGEVYIWFPDGNLQMFGLLHRDTMVFAQRFETDGRLKTEKVWEIVEPLDTTQMLEIRVFYQDAEELQAGVKTPLSIFIPGIPTAFMELEAMGASLSEQSDEDYPWLLEPAKAGEPVTINLHIRLESDAEPSVLRVVSLPVKEAVK